MPAVPHASSAAPNTSFAIDFGTTNSAIAVASRDQVRLVPVEGDAATMPTAVFYFDEDNERSYGRAAIADYITGHDGRLMRSMKSVLGSSLMDQTTIVGGFAVPYLDIIAGYLKHLKQTAEARVGATIDRVVLGRPVFFVDDDPVRDAAAQNSLVQAARAIGFRDIAFQYEPVAAALDYESTLDRERLVMVADIGGGTSDFCVLRASPEGRGRIDRKDDILGSFGVHIAGTDFDRAVELASILGVLGHRSTTTGGHPMPSRGYFELATWHLINTLYNPRRLAEFEGMGYLFVDPQQHRRLMKVLNRRLGHALAGAAEALKIDVADGGEATVALDDIETGLTARFDEASLERETTEQLDRIAGAAVATARLCGVAADRIDTLYLTGGSTGIRALVDRLQAVFPNAATVRGDRFASVASGLGLQAQRVFD